jgi:putative Mn2+ efflux pump MntP
VLSPEHADPNLRFATRGLPLPLSVDNVAVGAALGLAGFSPWLSPILFGSIAFFMSVAGHQIGRTVAQFIPRLRTDLLTGIGFVTMAVFLVVGISLPGG